MVNVTAVVIEIVVPACVTAVLGVRFGQQRQSWRAGLLYFSGCFMFAEALLHIVMVALLRLIGETTPPPGAATVAIGRFQYDFGFFALVLLGAVLLQNARTLIGVAKGMTAETCRRGSPRQALLTILAIALPLVPFVPHAYWFSVLSIVNLAALRNTKWAERGSITRSSVSSSPF